MEVGQIVMKIAGREAGKLGVILKKIDDNFFLITGPKILTGVKRRKVNVLHIEPTQYKIEIKEDASDEEVIEAFKKSGLANKLNLKFPSAAQIKSTKSS
jgi:large subunit ribosomal protein L14e